MYHSLRISLRFLGISYDPFQWSKKPLLGRITCWNTHSETICILKVLSTKTYFHPTSAFILNLFEYFFHIYWVSIFWKLYFRSGKNKNVKCNNLRPKKRWVEVWIYEIWNLIDRPFVLSAFMEQWFPINGWRSSNEHFRS